MFCEPLPQPQQRKPGRGWPGGCMVRAAQQGRGSFGKKGKFTPPRGPLGSSHACLRSGALLLLLSFPGVLAFGPHHQPV